MSDSAVDHVHVSPVSVVESEAVAVGLQRAYYTSCGQIGSAVEVLESRYS